MKTGARQPSIRSTVIRWLEESKPAGIDNEQITALEAFVRQELTRPKPVSRSYLLDILSHTEIPIARALGGLPVDLRHRVKFAVPTEAAQSLADMQHEYETAKAAGNRGRCEDCRRAVRQGKERLKKLLSRRGLSPEKRDEKDELLRWFLVWLESPSLFSDWLSARTRRVEGPVSTLPERPDK